VTAVRMHAVLWLAQQLNDNQAVCLHHGPLPFVSVSCTALYAAV